MCGKPSMDKLSMTNTLKDVVKSFTIRTELYYAI
jgi:hypothetical protein